MTTATNEAANRMEDCVAAEVIECYGIDRVRSYLRLPAFQAEWHTTLAAIACSCYSPYFDWQFSDTVAGVSDDAFQPEDICESVLEQSSRFGQLLQSQAGLHFGGRAVDVLEIAIAARALVASDTLARRLALRALARTASASCDEIESRPFVEDITALKTGQGAGFAGDDKWSGAAVDDALVGSMLLSGPPIDETRRAISRRLASIQSSFVRIRGGLAGSSSMIALAAPEEILHTSVIMALVWRIPGCTHFDSVSVEKSARWELLALVGDEHDRGLGESVSTAARVIARLEARTSERHNLNTTLGEMWSEIQEFLDIRREQRTVDALLTQLSSRRQRIAPGQLDARLRRDLEAIDLGDPERCTGLLCPFGDPDEYGSPWNSILVLPMKMRQRYATTLSSRAQMPLVLSGSDLHMLVTARLHCGDDSAVVDYLEDGESRIGSIIDLLEHASEPGTPSDTARLQAQWLEFWRDFYLPTYSRGDSPVSGMTRYQQSMRDAASIRRSSWSPSPSDPSRTK